MHYLTSWFFSTLKELRENEDEQFKQIFKDVLDVANLSNVEICMPWICGRQTHRININPKYTETYLLKNISIASFFFLFHYLRI